MCSYCGCHQVAPLAELMEQHAALLDLAAGVRRDLAHGDRAGAAAGLQTWVDLLLRHVRLEERGVFAALREQGDLAGLVAELEDEHLALDVRLDDLDPGSPTFEADLAAVTDELAAHIDKEDNGVFPATVVTLGERGWALVAAAHEQAAQPAG